ncbi:hypothetical protein MKX03_000116 [Papaver bracteatum]|nr:hypothetical protein MKX03_000116 [Papaver bracteatum]
MSYLKIRPKWKALPMIKYNEQKAKYCRKRAKLEAEFQNKCRKLFAMRSLIEDNMSEFDEYIVPNFWLNAMKSNEVLRKEIRSRDEDLLNYLTDIKYYRIPEGFQLDFKFCANTYFENDVLTKIYHVTDDDKPIVKDVKATVIQWTEGKNVTEVMTRMMRKRKNSGVIIGLDRGSFFNFFKSPQDAEYKNDWDGKGEEFQHIIDQDYRVGTTIRDMIITKEENDMDDTKQPSNLESSTIHGNVVSWFPGKKKTARKKRNKSNLGSCSGVPASEGKQG